MRRLAVTVLAEFAHRRGDLRSGLEGRTRAEEGISAQRRLQRGKPEGYQRERPVEGAAVIAGEDTLLSGRIDGCQVRSRLIEEYKTTRNDHADAHAQHQSVHWAQLQLYGGLLANELADACAAEAAGDPQTWTLRLVYVHPDSLATTRFERQRTAAQLAEFLASTLAWYDAWLAAQHAHVAQRDAHIRELAFPFADYRPHQRSLVQRAYRAMRDQESLLLEAPTGSGKTLGLLFPAVKALLAAEHQRLFYLTSRTTGAQAALQACEQLDPGRRFLRVAQITAKSQACAWAGDACDGKACEYARGYYDRIHDAVRDLLGARRMTPEVITDVAQVHRVCPFELSLDAARWADVIIGDYNYLFDPLVRLQRFANDPQMALLVDESHQLSGRVQQMLSLDLDRSLVRAALAEPVPKDFARRLKAIDRQLRNLVAGCGLQNGGQAQRISQPEGLLAAIERLVDTLAVAQIDLTAYPQAREVCFECVRWVRSRSWYEPDVCVYLASTERQRNGVIRVCVRMVHLDPGAYLAGVLAGYAGHIRFSGTVSPLALYQRLHGLPEASAERAGSPFTPEQLAVYVVDDVPTLYRQRSSGLGTLAKLVGQVVDARPGNYLVAFPSFDYLQSAAVALRSSRPDLTLCEQTPAMQPEAREQFLASLQQTRDCVVGMVVLGGVFAESVNLTDEHGSTLAGVICVGVGIPPPSVERDAMARYFDAQGEDGAAIAYRQPAMNKVLQVAGRLLRDPLDTGVLVLVDARFKTSAYQQFFPAHWQPRIMRASGVASALENFWRPAARSPRLPAAHAATTVARGPRPQ